MIYLRPDISRIAELRLTGTAEMVTVLRSQL